MNEKIKKFITNGLWVVLIVFVLRCLIFMPHNAYAVYGCIGETISITVLLLYIYDKWLWRYNPLEKTPVLFKKYKGTFLSSYDNIERKACLQVKQSLLSVQLILSTNESKSTSISASIDDIMGEQQLTYCYLNKPDAGVRNRSEIHYGTAMICIENPTQLKGQYFTDRKTTGDMIFDRIINETISQPVEGKVPIIKN